LGRDILGALEIAHHQQLVLLGARSQGEAAIAHDDRRHTVPAGATPEGIPKDLRIHMRVAVDEPWRDDMSVRVDDFVSRSTDFANRSNTTTLDSDVGLVAWQAGAVNDGTPANDQIVRHVSSFSIMAQVA
jgi:hypothetical protein